MRTARITIFFALVVVFCMSLVGLASAQGALTESAQMRIGYFAFQPKEFDTYLDGYLASFVPGLAQLPDVVFDFSLAAWELPAVCDNPIHDTAERCAQHRLCTRW